MLLDLARRLFLRLLRIVIAWSNVLAGKLGFDRRPPMSPHRPSVAPDWLERAFLASYPEPPPHWLEHIRERSEYGAGKSIKAGELKWVHWGQGRKPGVRSRRVKGIRTDREGRPQPVFQPAVVSHRALESRDSGSAFVPPVEPSDSDGSTDRKETAFQRRKEGVSVTRNRLVEGRLSEESSASEPASVAGPGGVRHSIAKPVSRELPFTCPQNQKAAIAENRLNGNRARVLPPHGGGDRRDPGATVPGRNVTEQAVATLPGAGVFPAPFEPLSTAAFVLSPDGASQLNLSQPIADVRPGQFPLPPDDPWPSLLDPGGDWYAEIQSGEQDEKRKRRLSREQEGRRWNG